LNGPQIIERAPGTVCQWRTCDGTVWLDKLADRAAIWQFPLDASKRSKQTDVVVDRKRDLLLGAKITFGGLDGGMAEQEFDLLEVATTLATQFRLGTAQIVRSEVFDADRFGRAFDHAPNGPVAQTVSRLLSGEEVLDVRSCLRGTR
jgi:hypothetical protein